MAPKRKSRDSHATSKRVKVEVTKSKEEVKSFLLSTLQLVTNLRDDSNRIISKEFFKLPSRKLYPDYYELIETPISLNEIKSKIINNKYLGATEFLDDFKLMNTNAITYNDKESAIAIDSEFLLNFVDDQVKQFNGEETAVPVKAESPDEDDLEEDYTSQLKSLIQQCINYKPYKRNKISPPFMDVVDGEAYPDYYKVIKKGMSFNLLLENLSTYGRDLPAFLEDINLIWINAQTYNDESSLLYQDSIKLCEYFYKNFQDFVDRNGIDITYEIPEPVVTEKPVVEEVQPEKKKRGRPRLETIVVEDPPPLDFSDDSEHEDELIEEENGESEEALLPKAVVPEPITLSKLNQIKAENGVNKFIGYKKYNPKYQHPIFNNFIKSVTVSSTRNLYKKSNLQDTKVGKFITSLEKDKSENEKFFQSSSSEIFEFKIAREDLSSTNFSISLKNVNTLQVNTILNMLKIGSQKFEQVLFFNGEKISASPSVYQVDDDDSKDEDKLSLSKFDINLLPGLNSLEFVCKVGPIILVDRNGKLPSRHATNPNNENNYITERCCIWITVDQY